jgi:hypothetical protein
VETEAALSTEADDKETTLPEPEHTSLKALTLEESFTTEEVSVEFCYLLFKKKFTTKEVSVLFCHLLFYIWGDTFTCFSIIRRIF